MKDIVIEEILRTHLATQNVKTRRGYTKPIIPVASRYPHSMNRAELELVRQPWNRSLLGNTNGYRNAA